DDQHLAGGVADDLLGRAAEQQALDSAAPVGGDHDEVGGERVGLVDDPRGGRRPDDDLRRALDALEVLCRQGLEPLLAVLDRLASPGPGPKSTTWSESRTKSGLCSTATTAFPSATRRSSTFDRCSTSSGWSPAHGSSRR